MWSKKKYFDKIIILYTPMFDIQKVKHDQLQWISDEPFIYNGKPCLIMVFILMGISGHEQINILYIVEEQSIVSKSVHFNTFETLWALWDDGFHSHLFMTHLLL